MKSRWAGAGLVLALPLGLLSAPAYAERHCQSVQGTLRMWITTEGCPTDALCWSGTLSGMGRLDGSGFFVLSWASDPLGPGEDDPFPYIGDLEVTTRNGSAATFHQWGLVSYGQLRFTSMSKLTGGTRRFEDGAGYFYASGPITLFEDGFELYESGAFGELCLAK